MAFNPFKGFRKYQKIWMALILLLCMVTFVLCTGVGGDLSDLMLQWFSRDQSPPMVEIDGESLNRKDMNTIKNKREIANTFIARGHELVMQSIMTQKKSLADDQKKLAERIAKRKAEGKKTSKADLDNQKKLQEREGILAEIEFQIKRTPADGFHFGGGVKFNQLIDHKLKLLEADRLGVEFDDDQLWNMVRRELFFHVVQMPYGTLSSIQEYVRVQHGYEGTLEITQQALKDEFRARIASSAISKGVQFLRHDEERLPLAPDELWEYHREARSEFNFALLPFDVKQFTDKVGDPKRSELRELFKKYQSEAYDPSKLEPGFKTPQEVKVAWVTADPKSAEYVARAKKNRAALTQALAAVPPVNVIPGAPIWTGLRPPGMDKLMAAGLISSDYQQMKERVYRSKIGEGVFAQDIPYSQANLAFEAAMYLVGRNLRNESDLADDEKAAALDKKPVVFNSETPKKKLTWTQTYALLLASRIPASARPETAVTAPLIGDAAIYSVHAKELAPILAEEHKKRAKRLPEYLTLVGGASAGPLAAVGIWRVGAKPDETVMYVPEAVVAGELEERRIEDLASSYAHETMLEVKDALDAVYKKTLQFNDKEPKLRILPVLRDLIAKYELKTFVPDLQPSLPNKWYSKYDIADAKDLAPLKKAFESLTTGRNNFSVQQFNSMMGLNQQDWVRDNDFPVLFFEGPSTLKWANQNWAPRVWPPIVVPKKSRILRLDDKKQAQEIPTYVLPQFEDGQIFLFWRTDERPSRRLAKFEEAEPKVVEAWRIREARKEKLIPAAEEFAKKLQDKKETVDVTKALDAKADSFETELVELPRFSQLYNLQLDQFRRSYLEISKLFSAGRTEFEYEKLIRNNVKYPSSDTGKQLVTMMNWKEPVKTANKEINKINKALFKNYNNLAKGLTKDELLGRKVQLLVNQPQTQVIVAVITDELGQQFGDFIRAYKAAASDRFVLDDFIMIAQDQIGKQFEEKVIQQIRRRYNVDPKADGKQISEFDQNTDVDG